MGSINIADCLTGLPVQQNDPVVAFVLDQADGGYPDVAKTRAMTGHLFSDICRIVSLPIHGVYADYKKIEPSPGQLSVALAVKMTGAKDWADFSNTALSFDKGALIRRSRQVGLMPGDDVEEPHKRVFGLAAMHRSSWDHLISMMPSGLDREQEVSSVAWAMRDVAARSNGGERGDEFCMQREALLGLAARSYADADGRRMVLPDLASAFMAGREVFGCDFVWWLMDEVVGPSLLGASANGAPWMEEFLSGVWDTKAFEHGMRWNSRALLPSASAGQTRNVGNHFNTALLAIEQASLPMMARINDNGGEGLEDMEALLVKLDALRARLSDRLDRERGLAGGMEP